MVSFSIATNRFYTDQAGAKKQDTEFHNVVAFGKLADIAGRYLTRGALVMIEGRIKTRNWTNQTGTKQYKTEIIAETMQLGPRAAGTSMASKPTTPTSNQVSTGRPNPEPKMEEIPIIEENQMPPAQFVSEEAPQPEDGEIDVKDIPF